ncbi:MAG TPA: response regulator [Isosphaeraceae bacterium]|jgi:signal transduction histidine kinase/DNA-binding response OmpR family regulator|nr:response regulator [Isosphaeraceae bacterium]
MPWISSSLRNKLLAGSSISIVAVILLAALHLGTTELQSDAARWVIQSYKVLAASKSISEEVRDAQFAQLALLATADPRFEADLAEHAKRLDERLTSLRDLVRDEPFQSARVERMLERYRAWKAVAVTRPSRPLPPADLASKALDVDDDPLHQIERTLTELVRYEMTLLDERTATDRRSRAWNQAIVPIGCALAVLVNAVLIRWVSRSLVRPIAELTAATEQIQRGDLHARVSAPGDDEIGALGKGFNAMAAALRRNARELDKRDVQTGVLRVAEVLATSSDLPHLLETALERILDVAQAQAGAIYVRGASDELLRVLVASGTGPELFDQVVRPGQGVIGRVARGRSPAFLDTASEAAPFTIHHWLGQQRPAELAYLPLYSGPDLVGVLALAAVEPFDDRTRNVLTIVAGQLGAAIQNAMSHQALQRQAVELEARHARLTQQQAEIERQNRELRSASQLKSEFLANMSHELRTPLTIILGFTSTVLRGAQGELNPQQKESLKRVHDNGRQLLNLINDILDLSKIEAGQMELDAAEADPRGLIASVVDNFQALAQGKGLSLRAEVDPALPQRFVTDENRLRQVLVNLVSNAVKFTVRGEVVVAARMPTADAWEVEVRDTGPGIAEEDIPKIFEQFRQLDGRTTRRAGGTGLGLSIVKRLVELLGGTLDVRSRLGSGTTFLVRLPLEPGTTLAIVGPEAGGRDAEGRPGQGPLVLSIDDDEDFLALLRESLRGSPFRFEVASNGRVGLALAERLRPDVITLDVMMPELDGWNVLSALKANPATAEIPVVLVTVLQRRGLGLMLGATDYLTKPLDRDRLLRVLAKIRRQQSAGPVLVIDDDPDIRRLLAAELGGEGFEVREAADGVEGLRLAHSEHPSLIVLDLMMPNMDGFEVASRLTQSEATRDIPILVLTAKELNADDIRRLNGKIEEILQKGALSISSLIARLISIFRSFGIPQQPVHGPHTDSKTT